MKQFAVIICILLTAGRSYAQESAWEPWDPEVLRTLHTGKDKPYLTEEEKKVILFMNMARFDGSLFAETFLESYIESQHLDRDSYVRSLIRDLNRTENLDPLVPEEDLTSVAQQHALLSGKTGHVGHKNFNQRFAPLMGNPYLHVGENCSYGYDKAIDIVMTLLIDKDVKDTGHRSNILNESFNSVGVAIRPHSRYRVNCVIDFGRKIRSDLNDLPF